MRLVIRRFVLHPLGVSEAPLIYGELIASAISHSLDNMMAILILSEQPLGSLLD